ncbi:MAG: purine-nucleoside phosphorylase [Muribaculaceae bacterium]|nr:purine-nucleoside phosphorylase [Muribaculaceae bacterium]
MVQEINWLERINETAAFLKERVGKMPKTAIILGTGLGDLVNHINIEVSIPYEEIPNFPVSTVEGHSGRLIFGTLGTKYIMAMQGRFHFYEGYSMKESTFPVRVMKAVGVKTLFVSNAAGGMNPDFKIGDLMIITDHINLFPEHPLRGKNYEELGPRFPGMVDAYSPRLIEKCREIAKANDIRVVEGVYVGTQGPTFETPAEYRYFWRIGGDAVGMSTVPEVIVANHADMEVFGMSVITDIGAEGVVEEATHEEVQAAAAKAQPVMSFLMKEIINQFEEL